MTDAKFQEALYYAVREDHSAGIARDPKFIDRKHDALIREAVAHFEMAPEEDLPPMCLIEVEALAHAANRRGIMGMQEAIA